MLKLNNQVRGDSNRMGPVATVDNEESRFETGGSLSESSKDLLQFFLFCFLFFWLNLYSNLFCKIYV